MNRDLGVSAFLMGTMIVAISILLYIKWDSEQHLPEWNPSLPILNFEDIQKEGIKNQMDFEDNKLPQQRSALEVYKVCSGKIEKYFLGASEVSPKVEQSSRTLVFLKASKPDTRIVSAEWIDANGVQVARANFDDLRDLRQQNYSNYEDVMTDAVELCIGSDRPAAEMATASLDLKDELEDEAGFYLGVDREWMNSGVQLKLVIEESGILHSTEFLFSQLT